MSRAHAFKSIVAVSLLSGSFAFAQTPPIEALPPPSATEALPPPPPAASTPAPPPSPPVTAASALAPGAAWSLTPPTAQRALTRERLRLLNQSLLGLPERSRSGRITEGIINVALGGGLFALGFLFSSDTGSASPLRTLLWFQGGYSALNGAVGLAWTPARERLPPAYGAMPVRTGAQRRERLRYGELALDEMASDSRLRRTLMGVGSAVLGIGTLGILYRDQIFDNAAMPEPAEYNYLIIGLSLVSVAANVITVFSQTEEERLRANYRQELQLLRESTDE